MKPPPRLIDDPSLAADLRAALGTRSADVAGYDAAAGLARFEAALAAPPPPPPAAPPAAAGLKALLAPVLAGSIAGVVAVAASSAIPSSRPAPAAAAPPIVSAVVVEPAPSTIVSAAPSAPPPIDRPRPAPRRIDPIEAPPPAPVDPPAASIAAPPPPAPAPRADGLTEEIEHMVRLRAASDPAAALALAEEGARRCAGGVFAQEREAIAIEALAKLGRSGEARARAERFLAAYPRSAFAERIRRLTGSSR